MKFLFPDVLAPWQESQDSGYHNLSECTGSLILDAWDPGELAKIQDLSHACQESRPGSRLGITYIYQECNSFFMLFLKSYGILLKSIILVNKVSITLQVCEKG